MVAEIDMFVCTLSHPFTRLKVGIFKFKYFSTNFSKINETLLPYSTFYIKWNEHKIGLLMLNLQTYWASKFVSKTLHVK